MAEIIQFGKTKSGGFFETEERIKADVTKGEPMARFVSELETWTAGPLGILMIWNAIGGDFPAAIAAFVAGGSTILAYDKIYNIYENSSQEKRTEISNKVVRIQKFLSKRPRIIWE